MFLWLQSLHAANGMGTAQSPGTESVWSGDGLGLAATIPPPPPHTRVLPARGPEPRQLGRNSRPRYRAPSLLRCHCLQEGLEPELASHSPPAPQSGLTALGCRFLPLGAVGIF